MCDLVSRAQTCNDMAWLRRVGGALCQLLAAGGAHTARILSAIGALLSCRFPLVRPSLGRARLQTLQITSSSGSPCCSILACKWHHDFSTPLVAFFASVL